MMLEITLQTAIIWKLIATFLFILVAKGLLNRVFKFKLVHWLVFVLGIIALLAAIRMDLVSRLISAFKKKETKYITVEKKAPEPLTPTVVIVPEVMTGPQTGPVEQNEQSPPPEPTKEILSIGETLSDIFYVKAPAGKWGPTVYIPTGYYYEFWPEEEVYGWPNPNNLNSAEVPFKDGPGIPLIKRSFKSVAWASRVGHDTRVKVIKKWIGSGQGR